MIDEAALRCSLDRLRDSDVWPINDANSGEDHCSFFTIFLKSSASLK